MSEINGNTTLDSADSMGHARKNKSKWTYSAGGIAMATEAMTLSDRSPSIGRVFSRAFTVMGNNPLMTFGVAFLLSALPQLALAVMSPGFGFAIIDRGDISAGAAIAIAGSVFVIGLILLALVQGVIVHVTLIDREGRRAAFPESIRPALGRALPLIGISLLFVLAAIVAWSLLVIPFFIVTTRWAVAPSVAVAERNGVGGTFSRSAELTAGARWKILGLGFLVIIVIWLLSSVAQVINVAMVGAQGLATGSPNPAVLIVGTITNTLSSTFWATMQASLYVELVDWKDGATAYALAEIFA